MSNRVKDLKRCAQASSLLAARVIRKTLPKKFFQLLGLRSDRFLEKQFRVHRRTIARLRKLLKIKSIQPVRHDIEWSPARLKLLGRRSDSTLARKFGVRRSRVSKMRRKLRIKAYRPYSPPFAWSSEQIQRLGEDTDAAIAHELGIPHGRVSWKRRQLGIPPFDTKASFNKVTWTRDDLALLGKHSDAKVSRMIGIFVSCVGLKRRSLGIPPKTKRRQVQWTEAMLEDLRKLKSGEFSKKYAIPPQAVYEKRYEWIENRRS